MAPASSVRPIVVRMAKLRPVYKRLYRTKLRGQTPEVAAVVGISRDVMKVTGLEPGSMMIVEGYADQTIRLFPAGDAVTRNEDE